MDNTLRKVLRDRKISANSISYSLDSIGHTTFEKYLDDPQRYSILQLREIASAIDMEFESLLRELSLIKALNDELLIDLELI